jgi:hypothetical protein
MSIWWTSQQKKWPETFWKNDEAYACELSIFWNSPWDFPMCQSRYLQEYTNKNLKGKMQMPLFW